MLESVKIQKRQSEIRQELATLAAKPDPTEDETGSMESLDIEYRTNETRFRAALTAEDSERREAGAELETRSGSQWSELVGQFELRQVALALDEGRALSGATAEIVEEMRNAGGYRGIPIPLEALEVRAGETIASGTPDPVTTRPIVDRLFASTAARQMGANFINIPQGEVEWPVVTQGASAAWAATETGEVGAAQAFQTVDKSLAPDQTLGVQMKLTRKALKQTGGALEQAVRRDTNNAISVGLDAAIFQGSGSNGEPLGVIAGASTYGVTETAVDAGATWDVFRAAIVRFMTANAVASPAEVNAMIRPETWDALEDIKNGDGDWRGDYDRLKSRLKSVAVSTNGLAAPTGDPAESSALLTCSAGGLSPIFVGLWGGIDLIRDVYSDAASGGLRLTALLTCDVTVARSAQLEVLTGLQ